ncbi:hypothetical protein [Acinetobacter nosocomialis]|uniref:hypothetical protein n=1 Tax=Acinetobacter nosocomialis TaxID=106654 RepID=UPI0005C4865C|nr:hypothetical protein [Acinetobacter nosocomialis]MDO7540438.1 hypothetical protein [Acinetobacter nosocomialis]
MTESLKTLKAYKLFKDDLSGVVIAFGIESQEIMDVQSQLLFIGSSAKSLKLWWQNERGLTNWSHEASTPEGVPLPSYRYERETRSCTKLSLRRNNSDTRVIAVRQNRLAMWPASKE